MKYSYMLECPDCGKRQTATISNAIFRPPDMIYPCVSCIDDYERQDIKNFIPTVKKSARRCLCGQPATATGYCVDCEKDLKELRNIERQQIEDGSLSGFTIP